LSRRFALIVCIFTFTACSTLRRQARDHYQAGEYLAAISDYEQILNDDPKDSEAKQGLHRSRQALLEQRLIEVRQQRLSENMNSALDELKWVVDQESNWQISVSGPAFSTQQEEVEEGFAWLNGQSKLLIQGRKYLKAKIFTDKYKEVFLGGPYNRRATALLNWINQQGTADCREMRKNARGPFSHDFAQRYCIVWGVTDGPTPAAVKPEAAGMKGYGQIALEGEVESLPAEVLASLSDSLLQNLKQTPYYSPESAALKIHIQGKFSSQYNEHPGYAVHSYQVQVPYTETNTVSYQEQVPYTEYHTEMDPVTGTTKTETRTAYRWETKYRDETETKWRSEPRSMTYNTTEFTVKYAINGKAVTDIDKVNYVLPLDYDFELSDSYHDTSNSDIGLYPKAKKMPTEVSWLKERFGETGTKLSTKAAEAWDALYCQTPKTLAAAAQMESIMKCLRGTHQQHDFVENWFWNHFGLSYAQVYDGLGNPIPKQSSVAKTN
jgi:hypothetical protein